MEDQARLLCTRMKDEFRLPYVALKDQAPAVVNSEFRLRRFSVKDQVWPPCAGVEH